MDRYIVQAVCLVLFVCQGVHTLDCYKCIGQQCPTDLSAAPNETCTGDQICINQVNYRNNTVTLVIRQCTDRVECTNKCTDPDPDLNVDCPFCCETDLCNINSPSPVQPTGSPTTPGGGSTTTVALAVLIPAMVFGQFLQKCAN
eukprot:TCONS_00070776-protein